MRLLLGGILISLSFQVNAELTSYHLANPIGWRHLLPVGESPGWSGTSWINLEINEANIWSTPMTVTDRRNGNVLAYRADFEQTSAIANFGFQVLPRIAVGFELPYANHNGGFLDEFIDQFHDSFHISRFQRNDYPFFQNSMTVTTNGQSTIASQHGEGIGGFKMKVKFWLIPLRAKSPDVCECGLALSAQIKFPNQPGTGTLSSGSNDYTGMVNFGLPFWQESGFWFTGAVTKAGYDPVFRDWPTLDWLQMYELAIHLGLTGGLGLVMQVRAESPFMRADDLDYRYTYSDPREQAVERVNSSWNSLVHWRGSEAGGFRYRWSKGNQVNLLIVEDWGRGHYDSAGAFTYTNNAPDVQFLTQWHFVF